MFRQKKQAKNAFTLVELIVVITILAILGTISFISLQGYSTNARDSTRISDLSSMKSSLELFQLDSGNYPQPTNGINVTYSGTVVWMQGVFGDTVFANVSKLDKIPTDPLTNKQYTYSITSSKNQYQLGGMIEGDEISINKYPVLKTNAGNIEAKAYITGNYNEQMTKTLSGTNCKIIAIPSIIVNDTNITDLQQIVSSGSLVYRGYKNLPSSFKDSKFKSDGGFAFQPNTLVAYSDTGSCNALTDTTSYSARVNLLKGLQYAYSGTILKNEGELKNIIALSIDTNNPSSEIINYAGNYVNNVLKGKVSTNSNITYSNCTETTQSGYTIPQLNHNQSLNISKTGSITNGAQNYLAQANCSNGTINISDEAINISCNNGYVEQAGLCVADVCGSTVPANAYSTATSQTISQSWTYNTNAGVCTFICDNNYIWNGSSCSINQNIMNQTNCNTAGWIWVNSMNDVYIGSSNGNGFCISPRYGDWNSDSDTGNGGISWNGWGASTTGYYKGWNASSTSIRDSGSNSNNYVSGQTRTLEGADSSSNLANYTCKTLGTASSDYDTSDTLVGRMKWLATTGNDYNQGQNIDWITGITPLNGHAVPSIFIADCIDGVKDLGTDMIYKHINNSIQTITYAQYNSDETSSTDAANLSSTIYQNRQKYLTAWTQKSGSHLPSAFSNIVNGYASASDTDGNYLTGNDRGEYQVACEAGLFGSLSWSINQYIGASDDVDNEWIWTASISGTTGNNMGISARAIGGGGCAFQSGDAAGVRNNNKGARFVVRP